MTGPTSDDRLARMCVTESINKGTEVVICCMLDDASNPTRCFLVPPSAPEGEPFREQIFSGNSAMELLVWALGDTSCSSCLEVEDPVPG